MRFIDTNILLYAASTAPEEESKSNTARLALEADDDIALSVQVLQEFYVQATRTSKPERLSHEQATLLVESFLRFTIQDMTTELLRSALRTKDRFGISYWDAAIIEAAKLTGCRTILSEDLSHGQNYGGVRVVNPFRKLEKDEKSLPDRRRTR